MAKLKDGFYKLTAEAVGSDSYMLLAGGGSKALSDFATASGVVTALGTNGNYVTWTKNGTVNNLTVPYSTSAGNADTVDNKHASDFIQTSGQVISGKGGKLVGYHQENGWHRIATIDASSSYGYGSHILYLTGSYNYAQNTNAIIHINTMSNIGKITQVSGYVGFANKIRLVNVSSNKFYVDIHINYTDNTSSSSDTPGTVSYYFLGNGSVTINALVEKITDTVTAASEVTLVNTEGNVLTSGNYTSWINTTNFPGLNKVGTVTSVTVTGANGLSGSGTVTSSGTITLSNSGVRSTTINGNYLRVNTNGTNNDLTIPYATNADMIDGVHLNRIIYSPNALSTSTTGTSEESNNSDNITRTMFWRDNNIGAIGVTVFHSDHANYGWSIYKTYSKDSKIYTKSKENGSWGNIKTVAYTSDIPTSLPANGGNADTVDGYHAGLSNGLVSVYVSFPGTETLKTKGFISNDYGVGDYGYPDEEFLQGICKWAIDTYADKGGITLMGSIAPNSSGTCILHLYSSHGKDSTTKLPRYCRGQYMTLGGYLYQFGTSNYVWSYGSFAKTADITNHYWANVKISSSSSTTTTPTFKTASATTSITTPLVSSTGRLTLNATSTSVDLKFNNDNTKSVILNGAAFKPFDDANNKLTLGSSSARWSEVYSVKGNFTGLVRIDGSAADQPLLVRGIVGQNGSGVVGELYLQYGANKAIMLGNTGGYSISADGSTYSGTSNIALRLKSNESKNVGGLTYCYAGGVTESTDNTGNFVGPLSSTTYVSILRLLSHTTTGSLYYRDLIFDVNGDSIWSRRVTKSGTPSLVSILHSGNYTSYVNTTNFPGLNSVGDITGVTAGAGLSGGGTSGSVTLTNTGVRSTTINGNYLRVNTNGTNADLTIPYATNADKVDGLHVKFNKLYYTSKSVTMNTVLTEWYIKIVLSAYAQPTLILIDGSYNNQVDRAIIEMSGMSRGYIYRNDNQNDGNIQAICYKTTYDSTEKKWIFWVKLRQIDDRSSHYSPSSSATYTVYLDDTNNAFDVTATTTAPSDVTWTSVNTPTTAITIQNATLHGNASTATTASKLGSSTLGGTYEPIYLSSGTATKGTSYAKAIKGITRSGTTFTYTCIDGTTGTFTLLDNNTTYNLYNKTIDASYKTAFRTQTKGNTTNGYYISAIRCNTASVDAAPLHGSGIAFGSEDAHGYLYMNYSTAHAYIGGGNADKLNWTATLLHSGNSSVSKSGQTLTVKINGVEQSLTNTTYSSLKNPNAIKFKKTDGTTVTYDGSSAADLTDGVNYATESITLKRSTGTNVNSCYEDLKLKYYTLAGCDSSVSTNGKRYAGTDNSYGFPVSNNANGMLWLGSHSSGPYGHQLGFSSDGRIYDRYISAGSFPTTVDGGSWKKVAWTSDITKSQVGLGNVQNTAFYKRVVTVNGAGWDMAGTNNSAAFTIYAPTTAGTSGLVLTSTAGTPGWTNQSSLSVAYATSSPAAANWGGQGSTTKIKIKINSTTTWMLSFVVTIYQGYKSSKVMISGYNYISNYWHEPEAVLLGDSNGDTSITVYFGYDSASNLWVGFDGGSYTGVSISDVTNGYTQISSLKDLFTISNVSSLSTILKTVTATNSVNYATSAGSTSNITVSNSDEDKTLKLAFHDGNALKSTGGIYCNPSTDTLYSTKVIATNFTSNVATGTQPYACTSTTVNTNLNADMVDGKHASDFAAASHSHAYLPLSGGTMTGNIVAHIGDNQRGIKFGSGYLNSLSSQLLWQSDEAIRFGSSSWDWNAWAGLKYKHSDKIIYLGLADGIIFNANSGLSGGKLYLPGISEIYTGNGTNKVWHAGNDGSGSGLDADLLDGLHLNSSTRNNEANKVMRTDGSGYANFGWINTTSGTASGTITRIYCSQDSYVRYLTPADVSVGNATNWSRCITWESPTTVNAWSKVLKIKKYSNVLLTIDFSQSSQASQHLYLISTGYDCARIVLLGANKYSSHFDIQVRITQASATEHHVEIYNTYGNNGATTVNFDCRALNMGISTELEGYTTYTAGSGTVKDSLISHHTISRNLAIDRLECIEILSTSTYNTVAKVKTRLEDIWNTVGRSVGSYVVVSSTAINNWDTNTAAVSGSSSYAMIKIGGAYEGNDYGLWLLSTYGDNKIGYVGRSGDTWTNIKWLATTDLLDPLYTSNIIMGTSSNNFGQFSYTGSDLSRHTNLTLGNNIAYNTSGKAWGSLKIYGRGTGATTIRRDNATTGDHINTSYSLFLPKATGEIVHHPLGTKIGSETHPVYINENGLAVACNNPVLKTFSNTCTIMYSYADLIENCLFEIEQNSSYLMYVSIKDDYFTGTCNCLLTNDRGVYGIIVLSKTGFTWFNSFKINTMLKTTYPRTLTLSFCLNSDGSNPNHGDYINNPNYVSSIQMYVRLIELGEVRNNITIRSSHNLALWDIGGNPGNSFTIHSQP